MIIYGVAILAFSVIVGKFAGDCLGILLGVKANVGGVGIAMLILIALCYKFEVFIKNREVSAGISFWSAMYIPIVVAMAAKQNVIAAMSAGPVAILAGVLAVIASFVLIPILSSKTSTRDTDFK